MVAGTYKLNSNSESTIQKYHIKYYIYHKNYKEIKYDTIQITNDIGLLVLTEEIKLTAEVQTINLNNFKNSLKMNDVVTAIGYGLTGVSSIFTIILLIIFLRKKINKCAFISFFA